jgi:UDP-N-acetylmuramoyl-L-alanyl-D-glutamate--2,6-diaminopimelate ligase
MSFATPLLGEFNVRNLLAALAALLGLGVAVTPAIAALSRVQPVRGRMERFGGDAGKPLIFVDYAHSPDSLERVLLALRALRPARLHCVFGCGGNRDRSKRPRMGEIAARLADAVIVTSDNPRDEAPQDIADEIVAGMAVGARYRILLDRDQAITLALKAAGPDDIVVIAGKGHEQTQETGGARAPHSDQATVERWLQGAML